MSHFNFGSTVRHVNKDNNTFSNYQSFQLGEHGWAELFKLPNDIVSYLWECVDDSHKENCNVKRSLAGNIRSSLMLSDKDNIILSRIIPYINQDNVIREVSKNHEGSVLPMMRNLWVNYQYKTEFNPLHWHTGDLSFVIWLKVPYDWENEKQLDIVSDSNSLDKVGNFVFVWADGSKVQSHVIFMNPNIEGFMCVFPSWLNHMVYPFYTSDDARVSISGNVEMIPNQSQDT